MKSLHWACGALLFSFFAGNVFALDQTAEALMNAGHFKRARDLAQNRLKTNPNDADALYVVARVQLAQDHLESAQALAEKAVENAPNSSEAHRVLGEALALRAAKMSVVTGLPIARRGKKEGELALSLNPKSIDAAEFLASYYNIAPSIAGGGHEKAENIVQTMMQMDPARAYLARATGAAGRKDFAAEEQWLAKAVQSDPKNYDAVVRLAQVYAGDEHRDFARAENLARAALKLDPNRSGAYAVLAEIYAEQLRWNDLDTILNQGERAVADDLTPYFEAAKALVASGRDNPRAERYLKKYSSQEAEAGAPQIGHVHWQLGLLMLKEGRRDMAVAELQLSVNLLPDFRPAADDLKRARAS